MKLSTEVSKLKPGSYLLPAIIQSNKGLDRTITVLQLDGLPVLRIAKLYRLHKKNLFPSYLHGWYTYCVVAMVLLIFG